MRRAGALAILVLFSPCGPLRAAPPPPAASAAPAPAEDRLKPAFEALPEADRRAIQEALLWTADYTGATNGAFGPRTREALGVFAARIGVAPQAALEPASRARLAAAAAAARAAVGFAALEDKQAGVTLGLPLKLLTRRVPTDGGTRYSSADGAAVVDTLSRPAGTGGLQEVFDRMSAASPTRRVTYKLLKPDFFVVAGEIGERRFHARFVMGTAEGRPVVRGLTLAYPASDAARWDKIALAAAAAFDASFGAVPPPPRTGPPPPAEARPATFTLNGIRIAPGLVLAPAPARPCLTPSLDGAPLGARRSDPATALLLFDAPSGGGEAAALTPDPAPPGAPLVALFRSGTGILSVAPAEVEASADGPVVSAGLQGQGEGAPLVDRQGRLAGLVAAPRRAAPVIAGTQVQNDYPFVPSARIAAALEAAGAPAPSPATGTAASLGAVAAAWGPRLLVLSCRAADPAP